MHATYLIAIYRLKEKKIDNNAMFDVEMVEINQQPSVWCPRDVNYPSTSHDGSMCGKLWSKHHCMKIDIFISVNASSSINNSKLALPIPSRLMWVSRYRTKCTIPLLMANAVQNVLTNIEGRQGRNVVKYWPDSSPLTLMQSIFVVVSSRLWLLTRVCLVKSILWTLQLISDLNSVCSTMFFVSFEFESGYAKRWVRWRASNSLWNISEVKAAMRFVLRSYFG